MPWARRPLILLLVAVLGLLVPWQGTSTPARAFELDVHIEILHRALDGKMSPEALDKVIGRFVDLAGTIVPLGGGNVGSDLHQLEAQRHFDSAKNPSDICDRWNDGLNAYMQAAVENSRPDGDEKRALLDRAEALSAFGQATHAIADFYSHSNWVEIYADAGIRPPQAPILGDACDPGAFPATLQTGYADFGAYVANGGSSWCPENGPPAGFEYCHDQLNKDAHTGEHAGRHPGPPGSSTFNPSETYHTLAKELAVQATAQAWEVLHDRIVARYGADQVIDAECLFTKLGWSGERTCHRYWRVVLSTHEHYQDNNQNGSDVQDMSWEGVELRLHWEPKRYAGAQASAPADLLTPVTLQRTVDGFIDYHHHWNITTAVYSCDGATLAFTVGTDDNRAGHYVSRITVTPEVERLDLVGASANLTANCTKNVGNDRTYQEKESLVVLIGVASESAAQCETPTEGPVGLHVGHQLVSSCRIPNPDGRGFRSRVWEADIALDTP